MSRSNSRKNVSFEDVLDGGPEDIQATALETYQSDEEKSVLTLARVLDGQGISNNALAEAARIHSLIIEQTTKLIDAYIHIGQHLIDLKEVLGTRAFALFIDSREVFPFGKTQAFKMMTVVNQLPRFQALLGPAFDARELPSLTVCYELTTFSDEELSQAMAERLFDPLTTQKQVLDFKQRIKQSRAAQDAHVQKRRVLDRLYRQIADAKIALRKLEDEATRLENELLPRLQAAE